MTDYGGMGGLTAGRDLNEDDKFEMAVQRCLGDMIRSNRAYGVELWSALANVDWIHPESGDRAGYSFRAAGDLIAAIMGCGNYMDWYCSGPDSVVSPTISEALRTEGWFVDSVG